MESETGTFWVLLI